MYDLIDQGILYQGNADDIVSLYSFSIFSCVCDIVRYAREKFESTLVT